MCCVACNEGSAFATFGRYGVTAFAWPWLAKPKLDPERQEVRLRLAIRSSAKLRRDSLRMDRERRLEAAGVEPASESTPSQESTCVAALECSRSRRRATQTVTR